MDEKVLEIVRDKIRAGAKEGELRAALGEAGYSEKETNEIMEAALGLRPKKSNLPIYAMLALFVLAGAAAYWFLSQAPPAKLASFSLKDEKGSWLSGTLLLMDKNKKVVFNGTVSGNKSINVAGYEGPFMLVFKCPAGHSGSESGTKGAAEIEGVSLICVKETPNVTQPPANITQNVTQPPQNITQPPSNITLPAGYASIAISVLDAKGANVSGAGVDLVSSGKVLKTYSTVNGTARIQNQSLGNYTVNVRCPANYAGNFSSEVALSGNASLNFTCDFANFTLSLRIAAGGKNVANTTVTLTHYAEGKKVVLANITDSGGTARFWVYPKGYTVDAQCGEGYAPILSELIVVSAGNSSVTLNCGGLSYTAYVWLRNSTGDYIAGSVKALNSSGYAYVTKTVTAQNPFAVLELKEGTTQVKGESGGLACDPAKKEITHSMLYSETGENITLACVPSANINVNVSAFHGIVEAQGAKITATSVYGARSTFTTNSSGQAGLQLSNTGNPWTITAGCSNVTAPESYEYYLAVGNVYAPQFTVQQSYCT